ncbi:hypothetical protein [Wolbachia endosymbiont (group A) of Ennomos erosarius]|uniref:hypothetical protein n=1 Tax=Wolbachia endosymbiont (group A) of Ennomos erosarius TaxID=3066174 RepID=UPI00333F63A7
MLSKETSTSLQDIESSSHKQSGHSRSPGKESRKTSRKRGRSVTDKDGTVSKRLRMDVNVTSNEDSEFPSDLQDKPGQDELDNTCQTKQYIPHHLIGIMYRLDLSVLCSLRESMYKNKYPLLSLAFGDSEIDKFNDIVLRYEKKSIHIKIENVDKYYVNNGISYARLFTKEKRSFSINNYFDSFVKHLISKSDSLSNNIEYLIVYTNSGFDLTKEKNLREGKFKNFYPFKFDSIKIEEFDLLKDFLFINDNTQESGFYRFSRDKTTKEELLRRLEFSSAMQKVIKERKISQEFEKEIKEAFLDKLVFAVNQPNREELNSIIKNEIEKNSTVEDDYIALQERVLRDLTAPEKDKKLENHVSRIIYEFNLLMLFLHDMFLYKNIFSINYEGKTHDISNNIALDYKDKITYVKAYNTNGNIGYSQLFPSRQQSMFSINKYFTLFVEELRESIEYFIIYTNANLDLTEEKKLKEGRSKDFYPLKFDNDKALRDCLCINGNGLYRFVQEEATRKKLLSLLKLPPSLQKEKEERRLSSENEQEIKEKFLDKLIFAINQPNREELNNIVKDEIDTFDVPYNYEELHEIALRWSESHEFGPLTKGIMEKLLGDIKNNRSSYKKIQNKNINEEIKFARSVVGREGIPAFNQFLNFLITGEGIKCLEVLKREGIDLARMSSILHVAGAKAAKAFKDLYDIWFNEQGNKTQYLKTLEKEGINLSNMSSILGGAGSNASRAFKDLHDLWFDVEGSKTQYLKTLEKEGMDLARMSSILSGAGANAAKAFKDLYDIWFNEQGNKTQYLKTLEKEGVNLSNVSSILNVAGVNAAKVFKDLYDLWFDVEGNKTQYLKTLEKEGIDLARMSSILSGAGANAAKVLKDLYDIWFDGEGSKKQYLKTLEKEGIDLARMSSILSGAGVNAAKAFKDLYDIWFDAKGNKKQHLKHFIEDKDRKKSFTLHNLSGILSRAGANAKDAFEKFHSVCFSDKGKRTELLDDFYKAGFTPSNLSSTLCGAGIRASFILKRFHSTCFNEKREKTKFLDDFYKAGFKPRDLCGVLSSAANSLKKFHDFCFTEETKKYLNHFLIEKEGFIPKNLSKILHGAGANICSALKDFHDVCFDETGNKTQLLDDFYEAGFRPGDLSNILSMAGNNAASILRNFHKSCFNKENYLDRFLAGKKLFTPKDLSKILYGVGINICPTFKKLHDLCFDKVGNITKYLNNLIKNNPPNKMLNILYEEVRKSPSAFLDEQNVSEGDRTTSVDLKPSSLPGKTKQKQDLDGLQQGDSKAKRKPRKGITNRSKNGQDDKVLDTVAGSSRDLSPRRGTREKQIQSVYHNKKGQLRLSKFVSFIEPVEQGLYLPSFEERGVKTDGKCVTITRGLSQALFLQSDKSFLSNLETSVEIYERIAQGKQISEGEEREVFALSKLLDNFERELDSVTNSLPSSSIHTKGYKTSGDLSNYIAGVKGDFAIHLVTSNHVVAIYRTGDNYAYFDSNAAFISELKTVDQLMKIVEKAVKFAGYKIEEKGFLAEHFDVGKANNLLSSEDKQILAKEIKTEHQLLAEQDKELGLIKINGQELSRVQLYDFGTKINVEGSVPLLINADMNLSSEKLQDHLNKKEVIMTAREYLDSLRNSKNIEEVVQATKVILFIGSKREIEEAEQTRKPKRSLLEQLVKGAVNFMASNLTTAFFTNVSRLESQLPVKTDNEPQAYLNDPTVEKQLQRSYQTISS